MFGILIKMSFRPGGKVAESHFAKFPRAETLFQPFDEHAPCLYVVIRIVLFSSHYQSIRVNFDISAFFKD